MMSTRLASTTYANVIIVDINPICDEVEHFSIARFVPNSTW